LATAVIDLNDAALTLTVDDEVVIRSPGYAVLDGSRLMVGQEAMDNARLLPRWTNNRFWNQLNTDPLPNAATNIRHHADLAFHHLESIWNAHKTDLDRVFIVAPGHYTREQLALLLGMAKECGIPVRGLVDAGVAAVCGETVTETSFYLDVFLHRITLTTLTADQDIVSQSNLTVTDAGLFTLWDRWANIVANQFVQSSRFDPLHDAVSEQNLYDNLPQWIQQFNSQRSVPFDLLLTSSKHTATVSTEQLLAACTSIYPQIVQTLRSQMPLAGSVNLYLSPHFRGFPGLMDSLSLVERVNTTLLAEQTAVRNLTAHLDDIQAADTGVTHITSLPARRDNSKQPSRNTAEKAPTHLLMGDEAHAIGTAHRISKAGDLQQTEDPVAIIYKHGSEVRLEPTGTGVSVNGTNINTECLLATGDLVEIGDHSYRLIHVRS